MEIWKDVPGFGGFYQASSLGRIRSKDREVEKRTRYGGVMKQFYKGRLLSLINCRGYRKVRIGVDGEKINVAAHTMVLLAFHGPKPEGCEACHENGNPADNRPENLRWDTHHNNNQDRKRHGNYASGKDHHQAKYDAELVKTIRAGSIDYHQAHEEYGISMTHFYRLRKGIGWPEVTL